MQTFRWSRGFIFFALFGLLASHVQAESPECLVSFDSAKLDVCTNQIELVNDQLGHLADEAAFADTFIRVVKFDGAISAAQRGALEAVGAEILGYVPYYGYKVRMSPALDAQARRIEGVAWVGPYLPVWKVGINLANDLQFQTIREAGIDRLHVSLHRGIDASRAAGQLEDIPGLITLARDRVPAHEYLLMEFESALLEQIVNDIAVIEEVDAVSFHFPNDFHNSQGTWLHQSGENDPIALPLFEQGLFGCGQLIGFLDSGLHHTHCSYEDTDPNNEFPFDNCTDGTGCPSIGSTDEHRKIGSFYNWHTQTSTPGDHGTGHGTFVAGNALGNDWGDPVDCDALTSPGGLTDRDGMAPGARAVMQEANAGLEYLNQLGGNLFHASTVALADGAHIHNNSWGSGCRNIFGGCVAGCVVEYRANSRFGDMAVWENPELLIFAAAGNSGGGDGGPGCGPGSDVSSPGNAKNVFGIGANRRGVAGNDMAAFSSRGPVLDRRTKPDIVAQGESLVSPSISACATRVSSGTSFSSPTAAGFGALVREYLQRGFYPLGFEDPNFVIPNPSAALIRAIMMNSSVQITGTGTGTGFPNQNIGWGRLLADNALFFEGDDRRLWLHDGTDGLETGDVDAHGLTVDAGEPLTITLVWHDFPAELNADPHIVNMLRLEVETPTGETWTQKLPPGGGLTDVNPFQDTTDTDFDDRNTVHQISFNAPVAGVYQIRVRGIQVAMGDAQPYALAATGNLLGIGEPDFVLQPEPTSAAVCEATDAVYDIGVLGILDFDDPVTLSIDGVPAGASSQFSVNPVTPDDPAAISVLTIGDTDAAAPGSYTLLLTGESNGPSFDPVTHTRNLDLRIDALLSAPVLLAPEDGATNVELRPEFSWEGLTGAVDYQIQVATDADFTAIVIDALTSDTSFTPEADLATGTDFFWRVRGNNACGDGDWSATFGFQTRFEPVSAITPDEFHFNAQVGASDSDTLFISNIGTGMLDWAIATDIAFESAGLLDFEGDFAIENWTFENDPADVNGSFSTEPGPPIELYLVGGNDGTGGNADFWIEIPIDGVISFDWGYQTTDSGCFDWGGYAINGDETILACNSAPVPFFNETEVVTVSEGDIFAFRVHTTDGLFGAGTLGVTNFQFSADACENPIDVPWLSVDPASGSTPGSETDEVTITADAANLGHGLHEAFLCVTTNTTVGSQLSAIPVTFDVFDPDIAFLEGTVTSQGLCGTGIGPLAGATVSVAGQTGTFETTTDDNGFYAFLIDQNESPVTITVNAVDHATEVREGVVLIGTETTVEDFDLEGDVPCIETTPDQVAVTVAVNTTHDEIVEIDNVGAQTLNWEILVESDNDNSGAGLLQTSDPLIGFNFTTAAAAAADPQNWTRISDIEGTIENVPDDTGEPTDVTFSWGGVTTDGPLFLSTSTLAADAVPQYDYDLSGMTGYGFRAGGHLFIELSGLLPNTDYEYWFVAYRGGSNIDNVVSVSDGDVLDAFEFNQFILLGDNDGRFIVNDQISSDTQDWNELSFVTRSSSAGTIRIEWEGDTQTTVIGAFAIRQLFTCELPDWLSFDPLSGSVTAGDPADPVTVSIDATGLPLGDVTASMCVASNDPINPLVSVPITVTVFDPDLAFLEGTVTSQGLCGEPGGDALEGATVSVAGQFGTFETTTDENGFYTFDIDQGESPVEITVSADQHQTEVRPGVVLVGTETTVEDFELAGDTACIEVQPEALSATVDLGQTEVLPLEIFNVGTQPLNWEIDFGTQAAGSGTATGDSPPLIGFNFSTSGAAAPDPQNWTRISSADGTVENAPDDTGEPTSVSFSWGGVTSLGPTFLGTSTLAADAVPQYDYDLSGMTGYGFRSGGDFFIELTGLVPNAEFEYWFVAYRGGSAIDNVVSVSDGNVLNAFEFNQFITSGNNNGRFIVNDQVSSDDQDWNDLAFVTHSSSDGTIRIEWEGDSQTTVIGAFAIRQAGVGCDELPWLSADPAAGTIDAGGLPEISAITFDPAGLAPGDYSGGFCVHSNDPVRPTVPVFASMTVVLPEDWATIQGTVESQGYCDADPAPLAGATVEIAGAEGTHIVETDEDGFYQTFLPETESPLNFTVSAPNHHDATSTASFVGGDVVVENFALQLDEPCIEVNPEELSATVDLGTTADRTVEIGNLGAGVLAWFVEPAFEGTGLAGDLAAMMNFDSGESTAGGDGHVPTAADEEAGVETSPATAELGEPWVTGEIRLQLLQEGVVLVPQGVNDRIMAFDPETGALIDPNFITFEDEPITGVLQHILVHPDNERLLLLSQGNEVHSFDLEGNYLGVFAPIGGSDTSIMQNTRGMAFHPQTGNLLVTSASGTNNNTVVEFDLDGNFLGVFVESGSGGISGPWSILFRDNDMLVSASGGNIYSYGHDGSFIEVWNNEVNFPQQLIEIDNGNILNAAFSSPSGVWEFDADGNQLAIYSPVTGNRGVYELPDDTILTTNSGGVHHIDRDGNLIETLISGSSHQISFIQTIDCDAPAWLSFNPLEGSVDPGEAPDILTVTFDPFGLAPGLHEGNVCVQSNDPQRSTVVVPVTMDVILPDDWAAIEGTVESLGHCNANPVPLAGATVEIIGAQDSYVLVTDEDGFYQLFLPETESPLEFTVTAPNHLVATSTVSFSGGDHVVEDFDLLLNEPCITVEPDSLSINLDADDSLTGFLELGNFAGNRTLHWQIDTAVPSELQREAVEGSRPAETDDSDAAVELSDLFEEVSGGSSPITPAQGVIDCDAAPGLIVHDDGTVNNGYSGNPAVVSEVRFVDHFVPADYPANFNEVCVAFIRNAGAPSSLNFEIIVFADDGPGGSPGTELGSMPASIDNIPEGIVPEPAWASFDIRGLGITIAEGGVYIGVRYSPPSPNVFIAADETTANPVGFAGGWWWNDSANEWIPIENSFAGYRALFVRATEGVINCDDPIGVPWLSANPAFGIVHAGQARDIDIHLDSTGLQPGSYEAGLCFFSNDPVNPVLVVPVNLNVRVPANWAVIEGTVETLGRCEADPGPLAGATVTIQGQSQTFQVTTDGNGAYTHALSAAEGPVNITASADGHFDETVTGIGLSAGATVVQDFSLVADLGCTDADPDELSATLFSGESETQGLTLTNTGTLGASFTITSAGGSGPQTIKLDLSREAREAQTREDPDLRAGPISAAEAQTRVVELQIVPLETVSVLVVSPDGDVSGQPPTNLVADLNAFPDVAAELYTDPVASITVGDLLDFDVVMTTNNNQWAAAGAQTVIGDVLADYVDAGGKVVVFNYAYDFIGFEMGGRFITENYGPFDLATSDVAANANMVVLEPDHPIFEGVTGVGHDTAFRLIMNVRPDAQLLAQWSDGLPMLAVNDDVVGFNVLYSANQAPGGWTGDMDILARNAALLLAAPELGDPVPWLAFAPDAGTVEGGGETVVDVTFTALAQLEAGTHNATIVVTVDDGAGEFDIHVPATLEIVQATPVADITPTSFEFELPAGSGETQTLNIGNLGNADLDWAIATDSTAVSGGIGAQSHDPDFDETFELPDFTVEGDDSDPPVVQFTVDGGVLSSGDVVGFSFEGTASGLSGTSSWASDTCMVIEAPDGTSFGVGGIAFSNSGLPGCGDQNAWDFQGGGSADDGTYASEHDDVFDPPVSDSGQWTIRFVNDWASGLAADIDWSDVTVTLHKQASVVCEGDLSDVPWLSVDPDAGTTAPGNSAGVDVTVDTTGMAPGAHSAVLCVTTNDPDAGLVPIPVDLTVLEPEPDPAPVADISPPALDFTVHPGSQSSATLQVGNIGGLDLVWSIAEAQPGSCAAPSSIGWLSASPDSGTTPGGSSVPVTVTVRAQGLSPGTYDADLCVTTNDPEVPLVEVPVTMTIQPPGHANLAASISGAPDYVASGESVRMEIRVTNHGPDPVSGALVVSAFDEDELSEISWQCFSDERGACGAESGTLQIGHEVDLAVDGTVCFSVEGLPNGFGQDGDFISAVLIEPPEEVTDPNPDLAFDEVVIRHVIFADVYAEIFEPCFDLAVQD